MKKEEFVARFRADGFAFREAVSDGGLAIDVFANPSGDIRGVLYNPRNLGEAAEVGTYSGGYKLIPRENQVGTHCGCQAEILRNLFDSAKAGESNRFRSAGEYRGGIVNGSGREIFFSFWSDIAGRLQPALQKYFRRATKTSLCKEDFVWLECCRWGE